MHLGGTFSAEKKTAALIEARGSGKTGPVHSESSGASQVRRVCGCSSTQPKPCALRGGGISRDTGSPFVGRAPSVACSSGREAHVGPLTSGVRGGARDVRSRRPEKQQLINKQQFISDSSSRGRDLRSHDSCDLKSRRFWRKPPRTAPEPAPLPTSSASDQCGRPGPEVPDFFMTARRAAIRDTQPTAAWGEGKTREGEASRDAGGVSPGRRGLQTEKAHPPEQVLRGRAISGRIFRHPRVNCQYNNTPGVSRGCCNRAETPRGDSRKTGQFWRPSGVGRWGKPPGLPGNAPREA